MYVECRRMPQDVCICVHTCLKMIMLAHGDESHFEKYTYSHIQAYTRTYRHVPRKSQPEAVRTCTARNVRTELTCCPEAALAGLGTWAHEGKQVIIRPTNQPTQRMD